MAVLTAWQTARLTHFNGEKQLQPLKYYLDKLKPPEPKRDQTPEEMLAAFRAISASLSK